MMYCQTHVNELVFDQLPWGLVAFSIFLLETYTNAFDHTCDRCHWMHCSIYAQIHKKYRPMQMNRSIKWSFEKQLHWVHFHAKIQSKKNYSFKTYQSDHFFFVYSTNSIFIANKIKHMEQMDHVKWTMNINSINSEKLLANLHTKRMRERLKYPFKLSKKNHETI